MTSEIPPLPDLPVPQIPVERQLVRWTLTDLLGREHEVLVIGYKTEGPSSIVTTMTIRIPDGSGFIILHLVEEDTELNLYEKALLHMATHANHIAKQARQGAELAKRLRDTPVVRVFGKDVRIIAATIGFPIVCQAASFVANEVSGALISRISGDPKQSFVYRSQSGQDLFRGPVKVKRAS